MFGLFEFNVPLGGPIANQNYGLINITVPFRFTYNVDAGTYGIKDSGKGLLSVPLLKAWKGHHRGP